MVVGEGDLSEHRGAWSQKGIVGVFVPKGRFMAIELESWVELDFWDLELKVGVTYM